MQIIQLDKATSGWSAAHPGMAWPLADKSSDGASRLTAQPYLKDGVHYGFQLPLNPDLATASTVFGNLLVPPHQQSLCWLTDLSPHLSEVWPKPEPTLEELGRSLLAVEKHADPVFDPIWTAQVPRIVSGGGFFAGSGGIAWDNVGGAAGALKQYLRGGLPPRIVLSNVIGMRNLFIAQHAPKKVIAMFNQAVSETAIWYHRYWEGSAEDLMSL